MCSLNKKLADCLAEHGLKAGIIDYSHALHLIEEIEDRRDSGELDRAIYQRYFTKYRSSYSNSPCYRTIIVIAAPEMPGKLKFTSGEKVHEITMPPTYVYSKIDHEVEKLLKDCLEPYGYFAEKAVLPGKLAAVRSGLGKYGRNNICYVPELGSFHRLLVYYSDMPCELDGWQEAKVMERCASCKICMKSCPTSCITEDRFLIRAENCLTHFDENLGEFPEWLEPESHNAIVGCMKCQSACPENKEFAGREEDLESFDALETDLILSETPLGELPEALTAKLDRLCLAEYYEVLPRNLKVLMEK